MRLAEEHLSAEVVAVDNLTRRGSERNLTRLSDAGITFLHADIRNATDVESIGDCDLIIDCAAEPSVHAGNSGSPRTVIETNLGGTLNALEHARKTGAQFLFLSTSRVYPIDAINKIATSETASRFEWEGPFEQNGISSLGIDETFTLDGVRSFYGTTKLSSEYLIAEYVAAFGISAVINRCGVLAGPWQFARSDQGVVSLWVARHHYRQPLNYIGFGGTGKQVRDILHIDDLFDLLSLQLASSRDKWDGRIYNIGGGHSNSVSLCELTDLCQECTGRRIEIGCIPESSSVDIRIFIMNSANALSDFGWTPKRSPSEIVQDIERWLTDNSDSLRPIFVR